MEKIQIVQKMAKVLIDYTKKKHITASTAILSDYAEELYEEGYRKREWISVDERLPEESGDYLTYHNGVISALKYSTKHRLFNAEDSLPEKFSKKHSIMVSHWMPLPEAPKGGTE